MKKNVKIIAILVIINIIIVMLLSLFNYNTNASNQKVSSDINSIDSSKYPGIKEKIQSLKSKYPNWNFKILYTGIYWNEAITYEYLGHGKSPKNLVPDSSSYTGEWVCAYCGDKEYDSGSWRCASESALKYMMDPRASLNSSDIFQFLELSYDSKTGYSRDTVKKMLSESFLDDDTYIDALMDASQKYNVNPYYITARILQEQGKSGTVLTKGQGYNDQYIGVYNVFNIGASGGTKENVLLNGLKKAQDSGWNTIEKSIYGGIEIIASKYIAVGQNTMYFQKFDVENSDGKMYTHQYMQNILAAQNEGTTLRKTLNDMNAIDYQYTFIIPVYENMPSSIASRPSTTSSPKAIERDLVKVNANPSIRMRNAANGNSTIGSLYYGEIAIRLEMATSKVNGTYWDKVLNNDGVVGYVARTTYDYENNYKEYLVSVGGNGVIDNGNNNDSGNNNNSGNDNGQNNNQNNEPNVKKGDVNNDGKITASDYVLIKNQIMGTTSLDDNARKAADVNGDEKITATDYVMIKNYIMGVISSF